MSEDIPFKTLEMNDLVPNPAIVIIAKRGSGKSCIIKSIMEAQKDNIYVWVIISLTEHVNPFYSKFYPNTFIYDKYDNKIFEKIINRQEKIKHNPKINPKYRRLGLIMDDCLADAKEWATNNTLKEIMMNGRHYDITYILTMQYLMGISPQLRGNFDYVILLKEDSPNTIKKIFDNYAGIFENYQEFRRVFEKLTDNYSAMIIVKRDVNKKLQDKIFHYKAKYDKNDTEVKPDNAKYFLTNNDIIKFFKKNYNKEWSNNKDRLIQNFVKR
jgi:hypothetical protein